MERLIFKGSYDPMPGNGERDDLVANVMIAVNQRADADDAGV